MMMDEQSFILPTLMPIEIFLLLCFPWVFLLVLIILSRFDYFLPSNLY